MRARASRAILALKIRAKGTIEGALASSIRRCFSDLLTLILLGTVLLGSLCIAGNAADYYSGQTYRFGTVYSPNWDYLWDASCCSDNTKPCCFDPSKTGKSTFEITAPIVDQPTEITISVIVRTKRMASCMDMAELKITVKPLKGLTVAKKHLGGDGTFPFTGTGFSGDCGMSSFSLSPSNGYVFACPDLLPGTYAIAELVVPGWDLEGITVAGTDPANYQIADNTVTIELMPNESPVITFTDKKRCSLTVAKKAVGGDAAFSFAGEGFPSGGTLESFQLKNGESASDQSLISGRAYTISEAALGGWDLQSITVAGTDPANYQITGRSITITPQPGESPTVTFNNTKRGSITIIKDATPNSGQPFDFTGTLGEFELVDDGTDSSRIVFENLKPGDYEILEMVPTDWSLKSVDCTGCSSDPIKDGVIIHLSEGDTATVRFVDTIAPGGLTVVKEHIGGDGTFLFVGTGFSGDCGMGSFSLSPSNGYAFTCPDLLPGTYTIAELVAPGWDLDGIAVAGTDPANYQIADNTVTIELMPNESPVITFTDKKRCSLTVTKNASDGDAAFNFAGEGFPSGGTLESFQLKDGENASDQSLISGRAYTISEGALGGWDLQSITVAGTDPANYQITGRSITITPRPGESPTVTFNNTKRGSIVVDKVASPPGSAQEFEFKPSYGEPFKLSDASDPKNSGPLPPGTYSIIETAIPDWDLTEITVKGIASEPVVDLVTGTVSFYLASGEAARVTYTNRKKQADISGYLWDDANGNCILDEGEKKLSGWTVTLMDASGKVIATDTTDKNGYYEFKNVAPGKYNLQTTLQPGWAPTCPPEGKVEIDLMSVAIVQNFGNRRLGSITVIKDAIPNGHQPFEFTGTLDKFELVDDGTSSSRIVFENLKPGDYEIKEHVPAGWSLISVDCTGCPSDPIEDGVAVHLHEGGSATVRFADIYAVGGLSLNKSTQNKTVGLGQDILYTITLCNEGPVSLTNVTLWDALPESVELVDVYPEPASYCHWTVGTLAPGECFVVDLRARVKKIDINYDMAQRVQGEGFVNVHNDYDTSIGPESVKNCAYAKADFIETISSCAQTNIKNPGTELMRREFGSGTYESEELSTVRTENKSIKSVTSLSATHTPTTFSLPKGRSIEYGSKWTEKSKVRNEATGSTMTEEYTSATRIEKDRTLDLNENGSTMRSDVKFEGVGHIGVLKKQKPDDHPEVKPLFESSEDYVGSFKIQQYADEYGTSVVSNKSTTGYGYVAVDKRIRNSQRTYESGTGFYKNEEFIETPTSYMAKNLSLTHSPTSFVYSPNFQANQSIKWSEGMWSKSSDLASGANIANIRSLYGIIPSSCLANSSACPGALISERYSYLDSLQKETVAYGLNEMKTEVSFSGQADYRVMHQGENDTDIVDNEERYVGSYDIKRHVRLSGVSKYDRPHLTVIKEGTTRTEWLNGTDSTLAEYSIRITNDGDRALSPIQVRDIFPPGTQYVRSTTRPAKLEPAFADWTLANLGIGDTIVIGLTLNVTEIAQGNLINRVDACGSYDGGSVCSGNYSVQEFSWLACCPPTVHLSKKAWPDELDPTIVHYRIVVANRADDSVAATVADQLPASMTLLDASIEPNTNAGGQIIWALTDIPAGKSRSIDYTARASRDGGFTNIVHIDAVAINGDSSDTAEAAAYIEINATGAAPRTFMYGGWEPPAWNLTSPDSVLTMEPELEVLTESPEE